MKTSLNEAENVACCPFKSSIEADGVRSQSRSCKSACDLVKIKNQNRTRSHKGDEIRSFPFSFEPAYDSRRLHSAYVLVKTRLSESEAEAEG